MRGHIYVTLKIPYLTVAEEEMGGELIDTESRAELMTKIELSTNVAANRLSALPANSKNK